MDISVFFFAADAPPDEQKDAAVSDPYALLLKGAHIADHAGFAAIWTPERHFHRFGGIYPDPAVTSAALAAITGRIAIRAGSVVLPLHDPIRVTEQWSMVDNLSGGRVGISFASGWHPVDFVLAGGKAAYDARKQHLADQIEEVRALWRGGTVERISGSGDTIDVQVFPRPIQPELPFWLTSSGNADTFELAGRLGANVLTHLLGQSLEQLTDKVRAYRTALRQHHPDRTGTVTLMVHTYLDETFEGAMAVIRRPFGTYLESAMDLQQGSPSHGGRVTLTEEDRRMLLDRAIGRYVQGGGLFGTVESVRATLDRISAAGVDEVACLIDFGVPDESVLAGLHRLAELVKA